VWHAGRERGKRVRVGREVERVGFHFAIRGKPGGPDRARVNRPLTHPERIIAEVKRAIDAEGNLDPFASN